MRTGRASQTPLKACEDRSRTRYSISTDKPSQESLLEPWRKISENYLCLGGMSDLNSRSETDRSAR